MATQNGLSWNSLFLTGSICDLDTGRWHARTKIRAQDLGILDSDEVAKALALGSHRLAPSAAFEGIQSITNQAKRALEYHSLNFAMIRGARYVPSEQLETLLGKLRAAKVQHTEAVDSFVANYASVKAAMLPVILQALKDACQGKGPEIVENAFARVQAEYPSEDKVRNKFFFKWTTYAVQSAKASAAAQAAGEEAENIKGVVKGMVEQLRSDLIEKVSAVMAVAQKGGKIKSNSLESAIACLDRVDGLNVLGDESLSTQTKAIRSVLLSIDPKADVPTGMLAQLEGMRTDLEQGTAEAVRQAEESLMGLGVRRLAAV